MLIIRKGDREMEKRQKEQDVDHIKTQRNADMIEYIAMMTDVEIPDEEEADE